MNSPRACAWRRPRCPFQAAARAGCLRGRRPGRRPSRASRGGHRSWRRRGADEAWFGELNCACVKMKASEREPEKSRKGSRNRARETAFNAFCCFWRFWWFWGTPRTDKEARGTDSTPPTAATSTSPFSARLVGVTLPSCDDATLSSNRGPAYVQQCGDGSTSPTPKLSWPRLWRPSALSMLQPRRPRSRLPGRPTRSTIYGKCLGWILLHIHTHVHTRLHLHAHNMYIYI